MRSVALHLALSLGLAPSLAACEQSGLQIVVYAPADPDAPRPDTVRLFVGLPEEEMRSMSPQTFSYDEARDGSWWRRDPDNVGDVMTIEPPAPAKFVFLPGDASELGVVIAVGYTSGVPTSAVTIAHPRFGDGAVNVYRIGLNPVADATDRTSRLANHQLAIWSPPDGPPAHTCVHVWNQRGDADPEHRSVFVGPPDDRDCDGLRDDDPLECSDDHYLATSVAPNLDDVRCVVPTQIPGLSEPGCRLGGSGCTDGVDATTGCVASRYCTATPLCTHCPSSMDPFACITAFPLLATEFGVGETYTRIKCTISAYTDASDPTVRVCPGDGAVALPVAPSVRCDDVHIRSATHDFQDRFELDGLRVDARLDAGCTMKMVPSGTYTTLANQPILGGLLAVDLDNGAGIGLPLELHVRVETSAAGCQPAQCDLRVSPADAPRLADCAGVPPSI